METTPSALAGPFPADLPPASRRLVLVSSMYTEGDLFRRLGRDAYSYRYVYRAFSPLLERWGEAKEVSGPGPRLQQAVEDACQQGRTAAHLSFLPLHLATLATGIPNVGVPAWEFPDVPRAGTGDPQEQDWVAQAHRFNLLITHTQFSQAAFVRAGVRTPVQVVPVPVPGEYFKLAPWEPGQRLVLDCPCYIFPQPPDLPRPPRPWVNTNTGHLPTRPGLRGLYTRVVKGLPRCLSQPLHRTARAVRAGLWSAREVLREQDVRQIYPARSRLELSGVVYTTILNPFDGRKNWQDLLTGYLLALRDCEDAHLVVKLVVSGDWEAAALAELLAFYRSTGIRHRCKLAFVSAYLSEEQLLELARGSTYYINTSRAEGSCLPLQSFMAARRPALAPAHTGMADSLDEGCGFLVQSAPEPACWPHDAERGLRTTWHRLVWQSLHDQLQASYRAARHERRDYQARSEAAQRKMHQLVSRERVWPLLETALNRAMAVAQGDGLRRVG